MSDLYFRPQALEAIARKTLATADSYCLNGSTAPVPIETIIEKVFGIRIEYQYLTNNGRELGRMIYDDGYTTFYDKTIGDIGDYSLMKVSAKTMMIDASLFENGSCYGRLRFTMAHELAHFILHKRIFSGTGVAAALYNNDTDEDNATEWQANYLGQAILMPNGQVKRCFYALRPVCHSSRELVSKMAEAFDVSKQAMETNEKLRVDLKILRDFFTHNVHKLANTILVRSDLNGNKDAYQKATIQGNLSSLRKNHKQ